MCVQNIGYVPSQAILKRFLSVYGQAHGTSEKKPRWPIPQGKSITGEMKALLFLFKCWEGNSFLLKIRRSKFSRLILTLIFESRFWLWKCAAGLFVCLGGGGEGGAETRNWWKQTSRGSRSLRPPLGWEEGSFASLPFHLNSQDGIASHNGSAVWCATCLCRQCHARASFFELWSSEILTYFDIAKVANPAKKY